MWLAAIIHGTAAQILVSWKSSHFITSQDFSSIWPWCFEGRCQWTSREKEADVQSGLVVRTSSLSNSEVQLRYLSTPRLPVTNLTKFSFLILMCSWEVEHFVYRSTYANRVKGDSKDFPDFSFLFCYLLWFLSYSLSYHLVVFSNHYPIFIVKYFKVQSGWKCDL